MPGAKRGAGRGGAEQSSGRDRLNIHGAIDLQTGQIIMKDVLTVDALSTILLLMALRGVIRLVFDTTTILFAAAEPTVWISARHAPPRSILLSRPRERVMPVAA